MKCPNCGSDSNGAFCSNCGTPLKGAKCRECSAPLTPGSNFCTNCGTAVRERHAHSGSHLPWIIVGAAALVLIGVLVWPLITGNPKLNENAGRVPISQMEGDIGAGASGAAQDPLSGTPREQADRLFNRIMTEKESGDTARAKFFTPMAIQAYAAAGELDNDGLYHLSLVHSVAGDFAAARATAEKILAKNPNHLLGLSAAANAARNQGDTAAAKRYYQTLLSVFDTESKKDLPEYQDHSRMFADLRAEAEAFVK